MSTKVHRISLLFLFVLLAAGLNAAEIQGVVSDQQGNPISEAQVSAYSFSTLNDSIYYHTTTSTDGSYKLENLQPGSYRLICTHPMYFPYRSDPFTLNDVTAQVMNITLFGKNTEYTNSVSGHVYGVSPLLPALMPLADATVLLSNTMMSYHTMSQADGLYEFRNILPGTYYLSAMAFGYVPQYNIDTLEVVNGADIAGEDIKLVRLDSTQSVRLSGHVWEEGTDTPIYPAEISLAPRILYMQNGDSIGIVPPFPYPQPVTVINNPDGSYEISGIPKGFYNVSCRAEGYETVHVWSLDLSKEDVVQDFYLHKIAEPYPNLVAGTVLNKENQSPVPSAQVYLVNFNEHQLHYLAWSDQNGHYQFQSIVPGDYQIMASANGFENSDRDTLTIAADTQINDLTIYLQPSNNNDLVTLSGYVWENGTSKAVYPARIVLFTCNMIGDSLFYWTQNNPDGSYKISNILAGKYTAKCVARDYHPQVIHDLDLTAPEVYQDFYLTPIATPAMGWITGKVFFDGSNLPVVHAYVSFYPVDSNGPAVIPADSTCIPGRPIYRGVYTDEQGEYKAYMPEGKYYVSCEYHYLWDTAESFYQEFFDDAHSLADASPVNVVAQQITPDINFGIPESVPVPTVTVSGRVTDDQNNPLEKALVRVQQIYLPILAVTNRSNCDKHFGYTDENGYYKIEFKLDYYHILPSLGPFPINSFIVSAEKPGYQIEFYKEKSEPYMADVLFAFGDTVFSDINFTLAPQLNNNSISGVITSVDGQPLANAFVIGANVTSGDIAFSFTDSLGQYTLSNLKNDYYYLLFAAQGFIPEFYDNVYDWQDATPVLANGSITGIDASLTAMYRHFSWGILTGIIKSGNDQPLHGVLVLLKNKDGEVLNYDITDANGVYQIQGLPDGQQQICISKVNYASSTAWIDFNSSESSMLLMNFTLPLDASNVPDDNESKTIIPTQVELMANYPNPFNPETHIRFGLPVAQQVRVTIYDILGKKVVQLFDDYMSAGMHSVVWNGTDHTGRAVASGIYFYALEAKDIRLVKKMVLSR